jgi:Holliday junction DNA helicase RuvA
MLSRLIGTIQTIESQAIELFASPFTFHIHTPQTYALKVDEQREFYIHLQIKEDGVNLFGFLSQADKEIFLQLLKVRSIGPKLAFQIMQTDIKHFIAACQRQDKEVLCSIPGIGAKTAARILAEIDVNSLPIVANQQQHYFQAKKMLLNLGFTESKIDFVLPQCPQDSLDELVKAALKFLGERNAKSSITS